MMSISSVVLNTLVVTLSGLILFIGYRQLLKLMGRRNPSKEDYCVLFGLESNPAAGEVAFYFTSENVKEVAFQILDENMNLLQEVSRKECFPGGNIIRFDTTTISNGHYFYCLRTDNQKTMKKMEVRNP